MSTSSPHTSASAVTSTAPRFPWTAEMVAWWLAFAALTLALVAMLSLGN